MTGGRMAALFVWAAASAVLVVGQFYVGIPYIDGVSERFALPPARAALVSSAFGVAYAPSMIFWGVMTDKWGRVRILTVGLTAAGMLTALAGALLVPASPNFSAFLTARALQGFAAASFSPAAVALMAERLPAPLRPLGASVVGFSFLTAAPLAQYGAVVSGAPLATVLVVSAPLFFLSAAAVHSLVRAEAYPQSAKPAAFRPWTAVAGDRLITATWASAATVLFAFASFQTAVQIVPATAPGGVGPVPEHVRLLGTPGLLAAFAAPLVTRRHGATTTSVVGLCVAATSLFVAPTLSPVSLGAVSFVLSAGIGMAVPGLMSVVVGQADPSNRGIVLGIYTCILFLGASAAPVAMQALAASPRSLFLVPGAALTLAALILTVAYRGRWRRAN